MNKKISIIGSEGKVGSAYVKFFSGHYEVIAYDPKLTFLCPEKNEVNQALLSVVCVPTPSKKDGSCDISIVEEVVSWLKTPVILIKSTIAPGTVDYLKKKYRKRIVFSPEYIGESTYDHNWTFQNDARKTPWIVLGGDERDMHYVWEIMLPIVGPQKKWFFLTAIEAEIVKYMENSYFATKITFANEFYEICRAFNANFEKVRQAWGADVRVDISHTACFPTKRGFGGKCLPKDLAAIISACRKRGYQANFLEEVKRSNDRFKKNNLKI